MDREVGAWIKQSCQNLNCTVIQLRTNTQLKWFCFQTDTRLDCWASRYDIWDIYIYIYKRSNSCVNQKPICTSLLQRATQAELNTSHSWISYCNFISQTKDFASIQLSLVNVFLTNVDRRYTTKCRAQSVIGTEHSQTPGRVHV